MVAAPPPGSSTSTASPDSRPLAPSPSRSAPAVVVRTRQEIAAGRVEVVGVVVV